MKILKIPLFKLSDLTLENIARAGAILSPRGLPGVDFNVSVEEKYLLINELKSLYISHNLSLPSYMIERKSETPIDNKEIDEIKNNSVDEISGEILEVKSDAKGLEVTVIMNSLQPDQYRDRVFLTEELKNSTQIYVAGGGQPMIEHCLPYGEFPAYTSAIGYTKNVTYSPNGIIFYDFIHKPTDNDSAEYKRVFEQIKDGYFKGASPRGAFYRDTGFHHPPGNIVDWRLIEHSYTRTPVDNKTAYIITNEKKALDIVAENEKNVSSVTNDKNATDKKNVINNNESSFNNSPSGVNLTFNKELSIMNDDEKAAAEAKSTPQQQPVTLSAQEYGLFKDLLDNQSKLAAEQKSLAIEAQAAEAAKKEANRIAAEQAESDKKFDEVFQVKLAEELKSHNLSYGPQLVRPNFNVGAQLTKKEVFGTNNSMIGLSGHAIPSYEQKSAQERDLPNGIVDYVVEVLYKNREIRRSALYDSIQFSEGKSVSALPTATYATGGAAGGWALPMQYVSSFVPLLNDPMSIRSLVTVNPAESQILSVPKQAIGATPAIIVAEGATKPTENIGLDMITIRLFTMAKIIDLPNQLIWSSRSTAESILRNNLIDAIRLGEFNYVLNGVGGSSAPYGLIPALTAADLATPAKDYGIVQGTGTLPGTAVAVDPAETLTDFVARGVNTVNNRFHRPDTLLLHSTRFWQLLTQKDSTGRYMVDNTMDGSINSIWGLRVMYSTLIPPNVAIIGDWKYANLYVGNDVMLDVSKEGGNRFDTNRTGFRIEVMEGFNAEQNLEPFTMMTFA